MKFKKGDRVKIIGNRNKHEYNIGDIITVGNVFDTYFEGIETTNFEKGFYSWLVEFKDCELLEEAKPDHYKTSSIDVIDFCKLYELNFNLGNVVKYVCRNKGMDKEDYKKAIDYLERELKHLDSLDN